MSLFLRFRLLSVLLVSLAGLPGSIRAQSLYDVVVSLSDRQRVLVQRIQVTAQLNNDYNNHSYDLPADDPINWIGVGANPSESAVNGLGVGSRIALLNQAVAEFDRLAPAFANMSPGELQGAGQAGTIAFHRAGDFTPLPMVTPDNQQEILRLLAQRVRALRVLLWPSAFEMTSFSGSSNPEEFITYDENLNPSKVIFPEGTGSVSWAPEQIGTANVPFEAGGSSFTIGVAAGASVTVGGTYHEDPSSDEQISGPLKRQTLSFSGSYPKQAGLRATAQGAEGTQIGGAVKILSRSRWHELTVTDAHSRFAPANGSFTVEAAGSSGNVPLFSDPPAANVSGTWVTTYDDSESRTKRFVETGYELKAASILPENDPGYSDNFHHSYEKNWTIGCRFFSVFLPDFTRGVDAAAARVKIDSANLVLADNTHDGAMRLHPRPNLLFGIDIGPGLNGAGDGMLTAGTMADALENKWPYVRTGSTYGSLSGDITLVNRFDSSYALRFAGSAADYHLVYDNNRASRTQSLPQLDWTYTHPWFGTSHDQRTLYEAWDSPRLMQVVGRDLIANITYNTSHYGGYTVTIFRRPENAAAPIAGQQVTTENLPVVRTWTFSKPGADTIAHPTDAEKLQATGTGNETFEIRAVHTLHTNGAGWGDWFDYAYSLWGNWRTTAWWWWTAGQYMWEMKLSAGETEKFRKEIAITTTNPSANGYSSATTVSTFLNGQSIGVLTSDSLDPFSDATPADWQYVAASKTIVGEPTPAAANNRAFRYGKLPTALTIEYGGIQPDVSVSWDAQGLMAVASQGPWKTEGTPEGDAYKITRKLNNQTIATDWIEATGPATLKHYSAPDGAHGSKGDSAVAWTEVQTGDLTTGRPGLPHKVTRSDGTGTTFVWTIGTDGAGTLVTSDGLMSGGSVTKGTATTLDINARGYTTGSTTTDIATNLELAGNTSIDFTDWGAPLNAGDHITGLLTSWTYDGNFSRLSSHTSPLGLTTSYLDFDTLSRPGKVIANGITASYTFPELGVTTTYSGTDIQAGTQSATTRDALGRPTSSNTTWNGVPNNLALDYNTGTIDVTRTVGPYGAHNSSVRQNDGSVASTSGPTLAFGGTTGDTLSVSGGLLVSKTEIADAPGTYQEIYSDAWGRMRKLVTPSNFGAPQAETNIVYSNPDSTLQRVITTEPSGRTLISESDPFDATGAVSRSGIDVNGSASLGAPDRYTESITTVAGGKVLTTLKVTENNGLRNILNTEWTPATGITATTVNSNEETITSEPNYTNKTLTTTSTKGWSKTETFNNLGLATNSTLSGTGIPTATLSPAWRADGSLAGVSFTAGGDTHSATFNPNGTLASLIVPEKGNILGSHTISGGVENLTIDGVTHTAKLDGTQQSTSGSDIIGKTDTLAVSGGAYKKTTHPATGADTTTDFNTAGAATAKTYAEGPGESYGYAGELLTSISLARGGALSLAYSPDGAKDLISADWPAMTSGPLIIPAVTHGFTYDRAGCIDSLTDAAGSRSHVYQNGRPAQTTWTTGPLKGYQLIKTYDSGRETGYTLKRDGAIVHAATKAPNGASNQISDLASGALKIIPQRDTAGRITGYQWGNASGTFVPVVTQSWTRGTAGRILSASSNVGGAPSFNYKGTDDNEATAFDAKGRRLKCATAGGEWTYQYTNGQLTSAIHPTLGTFTYQFDGIGRRTDKGNDNTTDLLNRTLAWSNSQNKTVKVIAHPDARVWFNGTEIPNFSGNYNYPVPTPGAQGGWVPWNTLAVLEGEGDAGANADAKAEQRGAVWVPPTAETLTYDTAGNRESSALWNYGWDAKNQLVKSRTKNYNNSTTPQGYDITNAYDAEGRRFSKKVNLYQNGVIIEKRVITFLHDGHDIIYERQQLESGLTTCERKYVWGPDISGTQGGAGGAGGLLLIRETKGGASIDLYPLYDGTGHVVALADSTGTLQAEYAYGPFGEPIYARGPKASSCPFRYATKYYDQETGLYNFGLRYLDPITGQWLSREPLGESESANLYSYTHNDSINRVDVLGLAEVAIKDDKLTPFGEQLLNMIKSGSIDAASAALYSMQISAEFAILGDHLESNPTPATGVSFTDAELKTMALNSATSAGRDARGELRGLWERGAAGHIDKYRMLDYIPRQWDAQVVEDAYGSFRAITASGAAAGESVIAYSLLHSQRVWAPDAVATRAGFGVVESLGGLDAYTALTGNNVYFDDLSYWRTQPANVKARFLAAAMIAPWGRVTKPFSRPIKSIIGAEVRTGRLLATSMTKKGLPKAEFLFANRSDAMNWARKRLGHNTTQILDSKGKVIGWKGLGDDVVYWNHGDWGKGVGKSTFPHLNFEIGGQTGHLFLQDKIVNKGMWNDFTNMFDQ